MLTYSGSKNSGSSPAISSSPFSSSSSGVVDNDGAQYDPCPFCSAPLCLGARGRLGAPLIGVITRNIAVGKALDHLLHRGCEISHSFVETLENLHDCGLCSGLACYTARA